MPPETIILLLVTGLCAGVLGGLLGIGGSVIMIPAITILLDKNQHLAQAAAMIVNVAVSAPAAWRHHLADAVRWDIFRRVLPFGLVFILIGVAVSDLFTGRLEPLLTRLFGAFLIYVIFVNILRMVRGRADHEGADATDGWLPCGIVGAITGFTGGLLGIGGGIIAVPLLQRLCRLPLRQCIATSSAVMVITAVIGATRKNMTLPTHVDEAGQALEIMDSLIVAGCLAPTAMIGGFLGARLNHVLPLSAVRIAFLVLLALASARMLLS